MKYEVNFEIYGKIDVTAKDMDDAINIVREMDRCDLFKGREAGVPLRIFVGF